MLIQATMRIRNKIKIALQNIFKFNYLQLSKPNSVFTMRNGWYFVPTRVNMWEPWVWGEVYDTAQALSDKRPKYAGVSIHMSGYMLGYDVQFKSQLEHPYDLVDVIK